MKSLPLLFCALLPAWVAALPADAAQTTGFCKHHRLGFLRRNPSAKPFCSSFVTATTTTVSSGVATETTRTTVRAGTTTVTNTITSTETDASTTTETSTSTKTITSVSELSCASAATSVAIQTITSSSFYPSFSQSSSDLAKRTAAPRTRTTTSHVFSTTPRGFRGKPTATISSLCSCLGVTATTQTTTVPTTTSTVTSTVQTGASSTETTNIVTTTTKTVVHTVTDTTTQTSTITASAAPRYGKLDYYVYRDPYDFASDPPPNVDVTIFKSPHYAVHGKVYDPQNNAPGSEYDTCYFDDEQTYTNCSYLTIVYQGYFVPPEDGTYQFTTLGNDVYSVDNYVGLWTGQAAYSNWNNNNANFIAERFNEQQTGGSYSTTLSKGQLLPLTLVYMNGGGPGSFQFAVVLPDGSTHYSTNRFWLPACPSSGDYTNPFSP